MPISELTRLGTEALYLVLLLSAPVLVVSLFVGLFVGIVQTMTQVQEQTLSFVPKLFAVGLALIVAGGWMGTQLVAFTRSLFEMVNRL